MVNLISPECHNTHDLFSTLNVYSRFENTFCHTQSCITKIQSVVAMYYEDVDAINGTMHGHHD